MILVFNILSFSGDVVSGISEAARIIGCSRNTLAVKIKQPKCFINQWFIQNDIPITRIKRGGKRIPKHLKNQSDD